MINNDNIKKQFNLFPIGKIEVKQNHIYMHILPDYKKALKYLKLFSHALIFIKDNEGCKQNNYTDKAKGNYNITKIEALKNDCIIQLITVRILKLEEKRGIVEIDCSSVSHDTLIFDIKPYFPCEDRVRNVDVPDFMSGWTKWRNETLNIESTPIDITNSLLDVKFKENYTTCNIGIIRKIGGECFLKLNDLNQDVVNYLSHISHIRVIWWFDKFDKSTYRKTTECNPPYENAPRTGVFATRAPVRPNPIALTTVKIIGIDLNTSSVKISKIDSFDKTPIINIVPYIPAYDRVREYHVPEWLKHWPQWVDDKEYNSESANIEIIESDIKRINKFTIPKVIDDKARKALLQKESQIKYNSIDEIVIKGARQNNLRNINCKIPKNKMTVITGVSGSGKSSLAFDTVYAESQRRFMDSLSNSDKILFEQIEKPDFDQISGLPPAIAIEQKSIKRNPRSTVGTMTDIYDYLKLLFSKIGIRHCPECGRAIVALKVDEIVNILARLQVNTCFSIRAFNSEEIVSKFIICDGAEGNDGFKKKLKECVIKALSIGNGGVIVNVNKKEEFLFQTKEICYYCNKIFFKLKTTTFSFNNPDSMCPVCKGLGVKLEVDEKLIISNPNLSILDGASPWWGNLRKYRQKPNANWMKGEILALAQEMKVDLELPWKSLPESFRKQALYGSNGRKVKFIYKNTNGRKGEIFRPVEGAYNCINRLFKENSGKTTNGMVASFIRKSKCNGCQGERLSAEGRLVTIAGIRFPQTVSMTIEELRNWVDSLPQKLSEEEIKISMEILKELKKRLENLMDVGVSYLTLDRSVPTLSGGEVQRLRLATQLGSGITNIVYVLDEPSIGLHPKDHKKLIKIMHRIRDEGNTLIVVEHDIDTMLASDKIIDIGPGAGVHGGSIIAEGTPKDVMLNQHSQTGKYLNGTKSMKFKNKKNPYGWIKVVGARNNNLKNISVSIPLGVLSCVTGVSGSGKSSLVLKTLYPALAKTLSKSNDITGDYNKIEGIEGINKVICISQNPIGRTSRSNPATYTGVFDDIRSLFSLQDTSKKKGYKQNKFSFNSKEGQCEACKGKGGEYVQMHFMPDIWVECSVCHGRRFNAEALEIEYKGKTIADVLDMNVEEALNLFKDDLKISNVLQTLYDVGLGYIKMGQNALTLSGGEAQRIKLAKELSKSNTGKTLYLLDEPTTGLHFADIENLLTILQRIIQAGNTVLIIEHNLDIIKSADWIIDLGPEGGNAGGYIVAQGTPQEISKIVESYTGQCLNKVLSCKQ